MPKTHRHIITGLILLFFFSACKTKEEYYGTETIDEISKLEQITASDTLRIATMYGTTSCFSLRGKYMGFDYEMAQNFAEHLGVKLKVYPVWNEQEMFHLLKNDEVDLIACKTVKTKSLKQDFNFVYSQPESYQVLVKKIGKNDISNVTQLAGKKVHVVENSIFHQRLLSLNDEIGGTILIETVPDSVTCDDLFQLLIHDSIQYTLAYYDAAMLYKAYFPVLDSRLQVGFEQKNGWLIRKNTKFKKDIERWAALAQTKQLETRLQKKYWKTNPYLSYIAIKNTSHDSISPYDDLFQQYAVEIDWDWRLLAALAHTESGFDSTQVSAVGAVGLMQLMPATAIGLGMDEASFFNSEENIKAGVDYIKKLDRVFRSVSNVDERIIFILASYNSGPAHVIDAMALAQKYGKDPNVWSDNVEYFLQKKRLPEFYQDSVVKYGPFKGTETIAHVKKVQETYKRFLKK